MRAFTLVLALLAAPAAHACPTPSEAALQEHLRAVNTERARAGQPALAHASDLSAVAQAHACDMAQRGYFSHTSPDGRSMSDRARRAGLRRLCAMGENIARGQPTVTVVMDDWMRSPGHRRNILDQSYTMVGFGHGPQGHWVQVFARRC